MKLMRPAFPIFTIFASFGVLTPIAIATPAPTLSSDHNPVVEDRQHDKTQASISPVDFSAPLTESNQARLPIDKSNFNAGISDSVADLLPVAPTPLTKAQAEVNPEGEAEPPSENNPERPTSSPEKSEEEKAQAEQEALEAIAREAQNPIANLISLPFQNNTNFGAGSLDRTQNILNIQPVIPINLSKDWLLVTRTIVPLIYQPEPPQGGGGTFGLGDINPQFYFVPKTGGRITWGVGPTFVFPTATDSVLGQGKWSIGPAAVIVVTTQRLVYGAVANNVWSFAGDGDRPSVSQLTFQPFINYNLDKGWYLTSSPLITANWYGSGGNQWTVPLGGGFGRVFAIGKQRVNAQLQAFWNATKPEGDPDWQLRTQFQLLFPK
jgi:hypothetical protein